VQLPSNDDRERERQKEGGREIKQMINRVTLVKAESGLRMYECSLYYFYSCYFYVNLKSLSNEKFTERIIQYILLSLKKCSTVYLYCSLTCSKMSINTKIYTH